jgi:hypothetical protein
LPVCAGSLAGQRRFCFSDKLFLRLRLVCSIAYSERSGASISDGKTTSGRISNAVTPVGALTDLFFVHLLRIPETEEYAGRMYISFKNSARKFIRQGESIQDELNVSAISPARLSFGEFPGYRNVVLSLSSIGAIVRLGHRFSSWQTALSVVKGIYVLTDRDSGKL